MNRLEYVVAATLLRLVGAAASLLPVSRRRVVLATARTATLEGNLAWLHAAMRARYPDLDYVLLLEPYSYGFLGKVGYFVRLLRGMVRLRTSGLVVVDNAYLPIHVAPHRRGTTVVQVWHAVSALKRFGADAATPLAEPERRFLHHGYDFVVTSAEGARSAWAAALRTPREHVLALGTPRTDFFFDEAAMAAARERVLAAYPALRGRRVVLHAPTFRGRGRSKRAADGSLDAVRLRAALPADHVLVLKTHPNLDPASTLTAGYDVVVDPKLEINELLTATDILVTDYSSSIFEWALLRRPLVLLVGDLEAYETAPGLYLDYRTEMIGTQTIDTDGIAAAILEDRFDLTGYDAFIERHIGATGGHACERFVETFLDASGAVDRGSVTLRADVRHE
jgi:CDP-ribitol ribitolphosphotransferase